MKKLMKATLSVLLIAVFLVQLIPVQAVFAVSGEVDWHSLRTLPIISDKGAAKPMSKKDFANIELGEASGNTVEATLAVGEVEELRDETTKYFRHEGGTFTAAVYPGPVHFRNETGAWQDIDNTLALDENVPSETGEAVYTPQASGLDIRIPQGFDGQQKLAVAKGNHVVALGVSGLNENARLSESRAIVVDVKDLASERLQANASALKAELEAGPQAERPTEHKTEILTETQAELQTEPPTDSPTEPQTEAETSTALYADFQMEATTEFQDDSQTEPPTEFQEETTAELQTEAASNSSDDQTTEDTSPVKPESLIDQRVLDRLNRPIKEEPVKEPETVREKNRKFMEVSDLSSAVVYPDIFPGADLEYLLTTTMIKENVIVKALQERYTYRFDLALGGLIAIPMEDGSIHLVDSLKAEKPLFVLQAPYMYDAVGEESDAVTMTLGEGGVLTLTADAAWINDEARELPVVIDPTLVVAENSITDAYVTTAVLSKGTNNSTGLRNLVGYGTNGVRRTYLCFNLPSLPSGSVAFGAYLWLFQTETYNSPGGKQIYAFDLTGKAPWTADKVTWNNQPLSTSTNGPQNNGTNKINYANVQTGTNKEYLFDITSAVKHWYDNDGSNNGMAFATNNENSWGGVYFASIRNGNTQIRPAVYISYANNAGLEDFWTYESVDLGRSGTAFANAYSGELTYIHPTLSMNGNRLPIQVNHVYNSSEGKFSLNIEEWVREIDAANYELRDEDGTRHYFSENNGKIVNELDPTQVLTVSGGMFIVTDDAGNKKHYGAALGNNTNGLTKIEDKNGDAQIITWTGSQITKVTDPAGREVDLVYANDLLQTITDPANRVTSFVYNGTQLIEITYPDGKTTQFEYLNSGELSKIIAFDDSSLEFAYTDEHLTGMSRYEKGAVVDPYETLEFEYEQGVTRAQDNHGRFNEYLFNNWGQAVNTRNHKGQNIFALYNGTNPSMTSNTQSVTTNLLENPGFEYDVSGNWDHKYDGLEASGTVSASEDRQKSGSRSMRVRCLTSDEYGFNAASQSFTGIPGKTYTLSADMLISGDIYTGGAWIGFLYEKANGTDTFHSEPLAETRGWERHSLTFTVPSDAVSTTVLLALEAPNGTVYFDNVQLEEGDGSQYYNHVLNSNFADASGAEAACWTMENHDVGSDGVQTKDGRNLMWMAGSPIKAKRVSQQVLLNAKAGDTLIIGGVSSATASLGNENDPRNYAVVATIFDDADEEITTVTAPFHQDVHIHHQTTAASYTLEEDAAYLIYSFVYENQIGYVTFDDAFVYIGNFGMHYSYDENNRLESIRNDNGKEVEITYNSNGDITKMVEKEDDKTTEAISITYSGRNVDTVTERGGIETSYTYDANHNVIGVTSEQNGLITEETMTYTPCGNYLATETDMQGNTFAYTYDAAKGLLLNTKDPDNNMTAYTYDPDSDELLSVAGPAGTNAVTSFTSQDYLPKTINRNGTTYSYDYDNQNRVTAAKVGNQALVSNTYDSRQRLESQTFATGAVNESVYDDHDRLVGEKWNNSQTAAYSYNNMDQLTQMVDLEAGVREQYTYDSAGMLESVMGSDGTRASFSYDRGDSLSGLLFEKDGETIADSQYKSDEDGKPLDAQLNKLGYSSVSYGYDDLDRLATRTMTPHFTADDFIQQSFDYLDGTGPNTTGLVESLNTNLMDNEQNETPLPNLSYSYEYDANGNITKITDGNGMITTYHYDSLNRLIREDNELLDETTTYAFDIGGNITTRTMYPYTEAANTPNAATNTVNYAYSNASWKDQLTSYDGKAITCDAMGNPVTYDGKTFGWEKGRQLENITDGNSNISYMYNAKGERVTKNVDGVITTFTYADGLLMRQESETDILDFSYDADGTPVGFTHNTAPYFYLRNLQGDVVAITNVIGQVVAEYQYDAWGNTTIVEMEMPGEIPKLEEYWTHDDQFPSRTNESELIYAALQGFNYSEPQIDAIMPTILGMNFPDMAALHAFIISYGHSKNEADNLVQTLRGFQDSLPQEAEFITLISLILVVLSTFSEELLKELFPKPPPGTWFALDFSGLVPIVLHYQQGIQSILDQVLTIHEAEFELTDWLDVENAQNFDLLQLLTDIMMEPSAQDLVFCFMSVASIFMAYFSNFAELEKYWLVGDQNSRVNELERLWETLLTYGVATEEQTAAMLPNILAASISNWDALLATLGSYGDPNEMAASLSSADPYEAITAAAILCLDDNLFDNALNQFSSEFDYALATAISHYRPHAKKLLAEAGKVLEQPLEEFPDIETLFTDLLEDEQYRPQAVTALVMACYFTNLFSEDYGSPIHIFRDVMRQWGGGEDGGITSAYNPYVAEINPIRYRGYYFDAETGYYFLQTRYYNPEWRRFLNADELFIAGDDLLNAANMYAYCNGNPVTYSDPTGMGVWSRLKKAVSGIISFVSKVPGWVSKGWTIVKKFISMGLDAGKNIFILGRFTLIRYTWNITRLIRRVQDLWKYVRGVTRKDEPDDANDMPDDSYIRKNSLIPGTHVYKAGRAGNVYLDDFYLDYTVSFDNIKVNGPDYKMPAHISHNYNSIAYRYLEENLKEKDSENNDIPIYGSDYRTSDYGDRWLTSYNQFILTNRDASDNITGFAYFNEKGDMIEFDNRIWSPFGTIWRSSAYNSSGYRYIEADESGGYRLRTSQFDDLTFTQFSADLYRLKKIERDSVSLTINFDDSRFERIDSITDGENNTYTFSYTDNLLDGITVTSFGNMSYNYDKGFLTEVKYYDSGRDADNPNYTAEYEYATNGMLNALRDRTFYFKYFEPTKFLSKNRIGFGLTLVFRGDGKTVKKITVKKIEDILNNSSQRGYVNIVRQLIGKNNKPELKLEKRIFEYYNTSSDWHKKLKTGNVEVRAFDFTGKLVYLKAGDGFGPNGKKGTFGSLDLPLSPPQETVLPPMSSIECESPNPCDCPLCDRCLCKNCKDPGCECRCVSNCACVTCNSSAINIWDNEGNLIESGISDGTKTMSTQYAYAANSKSVTDTFGRTVSYEYGDDGQIKKTIDGEYNETLYAFDAMRNLAFAAQAAKRNKYSYDDGSPAGITTGNGTNYRFKYGENGLTTRIGGKDRVEMDIGSEEDETRLNSVSLANGQEMSYRYGDWNTITGISFDGGVTYAYEFVYEDRTLVKGIDNLSGLVTNCYETGFSIAPLANENAVIYEASYDEENNFTDVVDGVTFVYEQDSVCDAATGVTTKSTVIENAGVQADTAFDWFGRTVLKTSAAQDTTVESSYIYDDTSTRASAKFNTYESKVTAPNVSHSKEFDYAFDNNGNITQVSQGNNVLQQFTYDEAQQLVREDNAELNQSFTYSYDNHGNILNKKTYAFTTGSLGSPSEVIPYAYGDASWPDMLTGLGSAQIVSDSMGNPIFVTEPGQPTKRFFWTAGRQLAHVMTMTASKRADLVSYTYDAAGLMTSKTVSKLRFRHAPNVDAAMNKDNWSLSLFRFRASEKSFTSYAWTGDLRLAAVMHGNGTTVRVLYDEAKEPFGIAMQSGQSIQTLLYEKNPQGDIISLINPLDGSEIACYTYDAFGNVTATAASPNPLAYRSYLYDQDIGMYYLKTRFYNPQWGRFLNADVLFDTGTGILGTNMFAYCDNNPVNKVDENGMWSGAVHKGYDISSFKSVGGIPHRNGVQYGTYTWATDIGYPDAKAKLLGRGSHAADEDTHPPTAGIWGDDYFMSWHMNTTYGYIEVLIADTREWRALGNLLDAEKLFKEASEEYYVNKDTSKYNEILEKAMHKVGYSLHPIQDMTGHGDDWVQFSQRTAVLLFGFNIPFFKKTWNHGGFLAPTTGADDISKAFSKHEVTYYHWDDVIWARDLTYDVIGRYYMRFGR